jgi:hypothetical protein
MYFSLPRPRYLRVVLVQIVQVLKRVGHLALALLISPNFVMIFGNVFYTHLCVGQCKNIPSGVTEGPQRLTFRRL